MGPAYRPPYVIACYNVSTFCFAIGEIRDLPIALHVPLLEPSMDSEKLRVMVDCQRGNLLASVPTSKGQGH